MPQPKALPSMTRKGFGLLRSIRAKMGMILFVIGASFGIFAYMIHSVLSEIDRDMSELNVDNLPDLELASEISLAAAQAKNSMLALMSAEDMGAVDAAVSSADAVSQQLAQLIDNLDPEMQPAFETQATEVADALTDLAAARRVTLQSDAQIETEVANFHSINNELRDVMTELAQAASVELNKGAVNTYNAIDNSLKVLVERDFHNLELLLEARAELNLLAGTAVAFGGTKDPETLASLQELADSSDARLLEIADEIELNAPEMMDVTLIHGAIFTLQSVIAQSLFPSESLRRAAMKARADTDRFIVMAIDAQLHKLSVSAARASKENGQALRELMKNEVGFLNTLMEISQNVNSFQVAALDALTAPDAQHVKDAAFDMSSATLNLSFYEEFQDTRVVDLLERISAFAAEDTGLAALRLNALNARAAADEATHTTETMVLGIADRASAFATQTLGSIRGMANEISAEVDLANRNMMVLLAVAGGVFLAALLLIQLLILRPLNRISASTEALAEGDRSPITGFERTSTEIYRIARSLSVFRDGIVEKEKMEEAASEERAQRRAVQDKAVDALGTGLARLSEGDLTAHISDELGEGYDRLRIDFNRTLDTLNDTVGQVINTSSSIRNGASEISQASQDLSHRTESQAATLEETAAALDEMTASVTSAATGARDVERTTNEARAEAEASGEIVRNAVSAMTEIEQSSGKIAQIISVIDDTAFTSSRRAISAKAASRPLRTAWLSAFTGGLAIAMTAISSTTSISTGFDTGGSSLRGSIRFRLSPILHVAQFQYAELCASMQNISAAHKKPGRSNSHRGLFITLQFVLCDQEPVALTSSKSDQSVTLGVSASTTSVVSHSTSASSPQLVGAGLFSGLAGSAAAGSIWAVWNRATNSASVCASVLSNCPAAVACSTMAAFCWVT